MTKHRNTTQRLELKGQMDMESDLLFSVINGGSGSSYHGPEIYLKMLNTSLSSKALTSLFHSQVRLLSFVQKRGVKLNRSGSVFFLPSAVVTESEKPLLLSFTFSRTSAQSHT